MVGWLEDSDLVVNTWQGNPVKEAFTGRELSFEEVVEDINKSVKQHTKNKEKVIMTAFIKARSRALILVRECC